MDADRYVLDSVRETDRDRFLGALFAPEPARAGLIALLAFEHELERTPHVTSEPMLARIRLQWWREAVQEAAGEGKPRAQPVVESLSGTMRRSKLDPEMLIAVIDAHEEAIEGAFDATRAGSAFADAELAVLGITDETTRTVARKIAEARLTPPGADRTVLLAEARASSAKIDRRALPILLPALVLDRDLSAWRKPIAYWWAAKRGRY